MLKNVFRGIFAIIVGCCLLIWPHNSTEILLKVLGVCFIVAGASIFIYLLTAHSFKNFKGITLLNVASALGFILLGFLFLVKTSFFKDFVAYLFGAILIIYGIVQIIRTYHFNKGTNAKATLYIVPILMTLLGIVFFLNIINPIELFTIFFGIALIMLGISELFIDKQIRVINKAFKKEAEKAAEEIDNNKVVDVEPIEVNEDEGKKDESKENAANQGNEEGKSGGNDDYGESEENG